jgi:hypothetical protein
MYVCIRIGREVVQINLDSSAGYVYVCIRTGHEIVQINLDSSAGYIYIYIYVCVCVCVCSRIHSGVQRNASVVSYVVLCIEYTTYDVTSAPLLTHVSFSKLLN